jgi:hypothetical protein
VTIVLKVAPVHSDYSYPIIAWQGQTRARNILVWYQEFTMYGVVFPSATGYSPDPRSTLSRLDRDDIIEWLQEPTRLRKGFRSSDFLLWINEKLGEASFPVVEVETAQRILAHYGFVYTETNGGQYYDASSRKDVVWYKKNFYLPQNEFLDQFMLRFDVQTGEEVPRKPLPTPELQRPSFATRRSDRTAARTEKGASLDESAPERKPIENLDAQEDRPPGYFPDCKEKLEEQIAIFTKKRGYPPEFLLRVCQDEVIFKQLDTKQRLWRHRTGIGGVKPKDEGRSLMVSDYITVNGRVMGSERESSFPCMEEHSTEVRSDKAADEAIFTKRMTSFVESKDPRLELLYALMQLGFGFGGSSMLATIGLGAEGLVKWLSEIDENGLPAHDIDLYTKKKTAITAEMLPSGWSIHTSCSKKGSGYVTEYHLKHSATGNGLLVDVVEYDARRFQVIIV